MAERYLIASGAISSPARWDGGVSLPGPGDDCYANGFTGTIDIDFTVASIRNGAGAVAVSGGVWQSTAGKTITADLINGGVANYVLTVSNGTTVIGDSYGGSVAGAIGLQISASTQIGNAFGGSAASLTAVGTNGLNRAVLFGNATAGTDSRGVSLTSGAVLRGDSFGGSGSAAVGVILQNGALHVGDSYGGSAATAYGTYALTGGVHHGRCFGGAHATAYGTFLSVGTCIVTEITDSTGSGLAVGNDSLVILQGTALLSQLNITASAGRYLVERGTSSVLTFIRPPVYPAFVS